MFYKNIDSEYSNFLSTANSDVTIFSPFIKVEALKRVFEQARIADKNKISIVTTWKTNDILSGYSDLELYPYCKDNGFFLYINQRIHLKLITDYVGAIFGSANITASALGYSSKPNYECVTIQQTLNSNEQIFLRSILQEANLINDFEYSRVKNIIDQFKKDFEPLNKFDDLDFSKSINQEFLISALPMSINIDTLYEYYSEKLVSQEYADIDYNCAMHDFALYKIPPKLNRTAFNKFLKKAFFDQLFIQELQKFISKGRYFGEIKEWVQKTCMDVPVPSRRDLTGNVKVLYEWFSELGRDSYIVDRPNHSERISPKSKSKAL